MYCFIPGTISPFMKISLWYRETFSKCSLCKVFACRMVKWVKLASSVSVCTHNSMYFALSSSCLKPVTAQHDFTAAASYSKGLSNDSPPVCQMSGSVCFPHLIFPNAECTAWTLMFSHLWMGSCRLTNGLLMCKELSLEWVHRCLSSPA